MAQILQLEQVLSLDDDDDDGARTDEERCLVIRDHQNNTVLQPLRRLRVMRLVDATFPTDASDPECTEFPIRAEDVSVLVELIDLDDHLCQNKTTAAKDWPAQERYHVTWLQTMLRMVCFWHASDAVQNYVHSMAARYLQHIADPFSCQPVDSSELLMAFNLCRGVGRSPGFLLDVVHQDDGISLMGAKEERQFLDDARRKYVVQTHLEVGPIVKLEAAMVAAGAFKAELARCKNTRWSMRALRELLKRQQRLTQYMPIGDPAEGPHPISKLVNDAISACVERRRAMLSSVLHRCTNQSHETAKAILARLPADTVLHLANVVTRAFFLGFRITGANPDHREDIMVEPLHAQLMQQLRAFGDGRYHLRQVDPEYLSLLLAPEHRLVLAVALCVPDRAQRAFAALALEDIVPLPSEVVALPASSAQLTTKKREAFVPDERDPAEIQRQLRAKHEEQEAARLAQKRKKHLQSKAKSIGSRG
jgi:hypothetical protein